MLPVAVVLKLKSCRNKFLGVIQTMLEVETVYEGLADKTIKYIHAAKDEKSRRRVMESRTVCAEEEEGEEALGSHLGRIAKESAAFYSIKKHFVDLLVLL